MGVHEYFRKAGILLVFAFMCLRTGASAQTEVPPNPSAPKAVHVPAAVERKLPNGLTLATVTKTSSPIVTVYLLVRSGAADESGRLAGLADTAASLLTKGTKSRTAPEIAEQIEFLGGSINSGANWNSSFVSVTVTTDKLDKAMEILSDVVQNPKFDEDELSLLRSQTLDGLTYNLKQPSFLANYVASKFSFDEHPAGGTPESIAKISRGDVEKFYRDNYMPANSVLIFAGDVTPAKAAALAAASFGKWKGTNSGAGMGNGSGPTMSSGSDIERILVIDLPKAGQASLVYAKENRGLGRGDKAYYAASVLNSVLGGGYSSRLNYEIRIKRGLSYGAGSGFSWRFNKNNFSTRVQTKNESAAEVAGLILAELKRLTVSPVAKDEMIPRKSVLTGNFGRNLETTAGLAGGLADLYTFGLKASELNSYVRGVNAVNDSQIKEFAGEYLLGGDLIIAGDYSVFKEGLGKAFPGMKIVVIKADELDLSKPGLKK